MTSDAELLREFSQLRSEAAFRQLVDRYIDLVYAAAVRRCRGDTHRAEDVAQEVFIRLAQHAAKLSTHPAIAAWLHTATRNIAIDAMMSEERRRRRENAALGVRNESDASEGLWQRLRPELDAAIDALAESDRAAIVLRYLQARTFAEVGDILRISEDAARMRTERALTKLRTQLEKRGITSTAAALAAIPQHTAIAAPPSLAVQIAHASVAAPAGAFAATFLMLPLKFAGIVAVAAAAFVVGTLYHTRTTNLANVSAPIRAPSSDVIAGLRAENINLKTELALAREENAKLQTDVVEVRRRLTVALQPPAPGALLSVPQQQALILNNLRQVNAARDQYILERGHAPASMAELIGLEREKYIRFLNSINGEDYSGVLLGQGQPLSVTTKDGVTVTFDPAGNQTTKIASEPPGPVQLARALNVNVESLTRAWMSYQAAHDNTLPKSPEALIPYFTTAKEGADFAEALEARKVGRR